MKNSLMNALYPSSKRIILRPYLIYAGKVFAALQKINRRFAA
jgi:hypothetical protein